MNPNVLLQITVEDFLTFSDRTIDFMAAGVQRLSDEQVCEAPPVDGMNSPYGLVTHALGAFRWWTEHMLCGYPSDRVRSDEFAATGTVDQLVAQCRDAKSRARAMGPELAHAQIRGTPTTQTPLASAWTVGACLLHAYEELAQHLGHLDVTIDLILADR